MMVIVVVLNTVLRYSFSTSIVQTEELCRYLFLWSVYLAVIVVYKEKGHICVTILTDRLGPTSSKVFLFISNLLAIYALSMLAYGSFLYIEETTMVGQVTYIPYKMMIVPVFIASVSCILIILNNIKDIVTGKGVVNNTDGE